MASDKEIREFYHISAGHNSSGELICHHCGEEVPAAEPASPVAEIDNDLISEGNLKIIEDTIEMAKDDGDIASLHVDRLSALLNGYRDLKASHPTPVVVIEERNFTELIADLTSYAYDDGRTQFSITRGEALRIARACAELDPVPDKHRQARIICDDTGCGEWNCDDCHPETKFPNQLAPVVVSVEETPKLPPLGVKHGTSEPFYTTIPRQQRDKWKKKWAKMDGEDCGRQHYKHYEWECRKVFEELEKREIQIITNLSEHPSPLPEPLVTQEQLGWYLDDDRLNIRNVAKELIEWRKWGKDSTK